MSDTEQDFVKRLTLEQVDRDIFTGSCHAGAPQQAFGGQVAAQALVAATLNAAFALGMGERVGSLTPGKVADVLVLDAPDYRYLGYRFGTNPVAQVIKAGRVGVEAPQNAG